MGRRAVGVPGPKGCQGAGAPPNPNPVRAAAARGSVRSMFVPVLLGSDINAYGMARSFHERYGLRSLALTTFPLLPIRYSSIVEMEVHPDLATPEGFLRVLREVAARYQGSGKKLLLVACGDAYATLVSHHQDEIAGLYEFATVDPSLLDRLLDKETFYGLCAEHGIDHPATVALHHDTWEDELAKELPFTFPVVLKPADTVTWSRVSFPGKKKAFVLDTPQELRAMVAAGYGTAYKDPLIVQDFIPGGDSNMRVLNAYVSRSGKVQMMCLGNPLLEDHAPTLIGNYTAIIDDSDEGVYRQIGGFLEAIGYRGFANFDMKFDSRDGKYKLFELNPRQGRSSFYVTLAGYNLAEYLVEDLIHGRERDEPVLGGNESLWLGIPKRILAKYAEDTPAKRRALALVKQGKYGSTLFYKKEKNPVRLAKLAVMYARYFENYRRYYRPAGSASA